MNSNNTSDKPTTNKNKKPPTNHVSAYISRDMQSNHASNLQ